MQKTYQSGYKQASWLLGRLIGGDANIIEQINKGICSIGIAGFLKSLDAYDFPQEVKGKLAAVRDLLFVIGLEPIPEHTVDEHAVNRDAAEGGELE